MDPSCPPPYWTTATPICTCTHLVSDNTHGQKHELQNIWSSSCFSRFHTGHPLPERVTFFPFCSHYLIAGNEWNEFQSNWRLFLIRLSCILFLFLWWWQVLALSNVGVGCETFMVRKCVSVPRPVLSWVNITFLLTTGVTLHLGFLFCFSFKSAVADREWCLLLWHFGAHGTEPVHSGVLQQWQTMSQTLQQPCLSFAFRLVVTVNCIQKLKS